MGLARLLQKAGCGTRRETEALVTGGRVTVGGEICTDPRSAVEPGQEVLVDGADLDDMRYRYFAFHKPARVVCTESDGPDRRLVSEFLPGSIPGLRTAGRLDSKTTGLLLISNDPSWNTIVVESGIIEQEYRLQVEGELTDLEMGLVTTGVHLPGMGIFRPLSVQIVEMMSGRTVVNIVVREGKVRQIRRMFGTLRHRIQLLRRIRIGDIRLADLSAGTLRALTGREIESVREAGRRAAVAEPVAEPVVPEEDS